MSVQDYQGNIHNSDESIERFSQPLNVGYWLKSNDEYISNNVKLRLPDIPFYQSRFWHYWKKTKTTIQLLSFCNALFSKIFAAFSSFIFLQF